MSLAIVSDEGTSLRAPGSLQDWKKEARFTGFGRFEFCNDVACAAFDPGFRLAGPHRSLSRTRL